jgi:hypothetical protein
MSRSRKHHGQPLVISGCDDFFVADGATWLDNAYGAGFGGLKESVGKWEEGI